MKPFLNELKRIPRNYMKPSIKNMLKKAKSIEVNRLLHNQVHSKQKKDWTQETLIEMIKQDKAKEKELML